MVTWRMLLSLQVQIREEERWSAQLDVPTAYLWTTERKHRVFMKQAPGCEEPGSEGMVWELESYLYGEPPAGLEWFLKLAAKFAEHGYERNPACPCMFLKISKKEAPYDAEWYDDPKNAHRRVNVRGPDGTVGVLGRDFYATYILLQVDDGKIAGNCEEDVKELQKIMAEFDTKWHAPCADYIGAEETAVGANTIKVTAKKQLEKFARSYSDHLTGSRERVPARAGDAYKPLAGCMEAADEEERREMAAKPYRQVIGSAAYPARLCHPSIAYALSELSHST